MGVAEYAQFDGLGLAELVSRGEVTPFELVAEAMARIDRLNPILNAIVFHTPGRARARAKGRLPDGPFKGVPFLMKDILGFETGTPTRQASRFIPESPVDHDSELTRRFENAGLISLGKTNTPEFGLVPTTESALYGPARNPWNVEHSPGGSSGGAAAAVAAGIVPAAHANDGGGSIRIPASCCGLVGLKPSRARTTLAPDLGDIMGGLVVEHVLSRTVRDTAAMLDCVAGPAPGDPYFAPPPAASYMDAVRRPFADSTRRLRAAYSVSDPRGGSADPECRAAVEFAAKTCAALGHEVEEGAPPLRRERLEQAFMTIWGAGLAASIDAFAMIYRLRPREEAFEPLTWALYQTGKTISGSQYLMSWAFLQQEARRIAQWHERYDVWLTPVLAKPPLKLGAIDTRASDWRKTLAVIADYAPFTALQNVTGQPAISLPLHWTADGLPVGCQFVARFGEEDVLLSLAAQLEEAAPWKKRRPAIWG